MSKLDGYRRERIKKVFYDKWWSRSIVDGTKKGNRIIGMEILPAAGLPAMKDYQNGSFQYCGATAQAVLLEVGAMKSAINLISAGKATWGTARYNKMLNGGKAFASFPWGSPAKEKEHKAAGSLRRAITAREMRMRFINDDELLHEWMPELLVRINSDSSFHGHVMLVEEVSLEMSSRELCVRTMEGNAHGDMPNGKYGEGVVVNKRFIRDLDLDSYWLIKLSDLDWKVGM